jgi:hypothetical protein
MGISRGVSSHLDRHANSFSFMKLTGLQECVQAAGFFKRPSFGSGIGGTRGSCYKVQGVSFPQTTDGSGKCQPGYGAPPFKIRAF